MAEQPLRYIYRQYCPLIALHISDSPQHILVRPSDGLQAQPSLRRRSLSSRGGCLPLPRATDDRRASISASEKSDAAYSIRVILSHLSTLSRFYASFYRRNQIFKGFLRLKLQPGKPFNVLIGFYARGGPLTCKAPACGRASRNGPWRFPRQRRTAPQLSRGMRGSGWSNALRSR